MDIIGYTIYELPGWIALKGSIQPDCQGDSVCRFGKT